MSSYSATRLAHLPSKRGAAVLGFDADGLMAAALRRSGRENFSDLSFVEPLKQLLLSYERESDLSLFGRYATHFDVMRALVNLLRLDAAEEDDPAILSRPICAPVFITGLPRSATSFLHELAAQDPALSVPRCWQLIYPYPGNARLMGADLRRLKVDMQLRLFRCLSPGVGALHPMAADSPQECTDITAQIFQSLRFDNTHRIPSYTAWLDSRGHLGAFRFHRRFLQHLSGTTPRRWTLKSPDHVFALNAIRAVYPDARIVFLHRDPLSVVASCCKLAELLRRPFTRKIDLHEIGQQVSGRLVQSAERMMEVARAGGILHLHYRQVVADPMRAIEMLYRACGLDLSAQARERMQAWLARPLPRPAKRYRLEEFGLEARALRRRFASYMEAFAIEPEWAPS